MADETANLPAGAWIVPADMGLSHLAVGVNIGCWYSGGTARGGGKLEGGYLHIDADPAEGLAGMLDSVHPDDRAAILEAANVAAHTGGELSLPFRTAGHPVRFLRIAARVCEEDGVLKLPTGLLMDETPEVLAQARLANLTETTPAMLWIMEPNGFCSYFSKSWYEYTGQGPADALGLGWLRAIHPQDLPLAEEHATRAAQMKTQFSIEHRLRRRDGTWRWVLCVGNPRFDRDGRFLGHSGAVTEIHDRKLWERWQRNGYESDKGSDR